MKHTTTSISAYWLRSKCSICSLRPSLGIGRATPSSFGLFQRSVRGSLHDSLVGTNPLAAACSPAKKGRVPLVALGFARPKRFWKPGVGRRPDLVWGAPLPEVCSSPMDCFWAVRRAIFAKGDNVLHRLLAALGFRGDLFGRGPGGYHPMLPRLPTQSSSLQVRRGGSGKPAQSPLWDVVARPIKQ